MNDEHVDQLHAGQQGVVVLEQSAFYAESGGQAGDIGQITTDNASFNVIDTHKQGKAFAHIGQLENGSLNIGDAVTAHIDESNRIATSLNHSATHLLHAALQQLLGEHVTQKGSLVNSDRLRFDFSHFEPVNQQQLHSIERLVNQQIRINHNVNTDVMNIDQAKATGAMALFGEKYDAKVRVLSMGKFSTELCGGTHVNRTGDIGLIKITSEVGIASGVRRIEAVTGEKALEVIESNQEKLLALATLLKAEPDNIKEKIELLIQKSRQFEKELDKLKRKLASSAGTDLASSAQNLSGINVIASHLEGVNGKSLRDTVDELKNKLAPAAIILSTIEDGKITLIAGVTKDITDKVSAGDLVSHVALQVGGKGGGRSDMAQGGGNQPDKLASALDSVTDWILSHMES